MTHKELFEALLAGKKVTDNNGRIYFLEDDNVYFNGDHGYRVLTYIDAEVDYFTIYEEPKYQVLFKTPNGDFKTSFGLYSSKEEFEKNHYERINEFVKLLKPNEI